MTTDAKITVNVDPRFQVEQAASKDEARYTLTSVYLDPSKKRLVATSGHILASVPVETEATGPARLVSPETLVAARKAAKKLKHPTAELTFGAKDEGTVALVDGSTRPRPDGDPQGFPAYERVIPKFDKETPGTFTVGLDPELLIALAKAIGATERGTKGVVLTFDLSQGDSGPILVRPNHTNDTAFGVLMPMRHETGEAANQREKTYRAMAEAVQPQEAKKGAA